MVDASPSDASETGTDSPIHPEQAKPEGEADSESHEFSKDDDRGERGNAEEKEIRDEGRGFAIREGGDGPSDQGREGQQADSRVSTRSWQVG